MSSPAQPHGVAGTFARRLGGEQHRTADGVAAEQGSLRPAQHLHAGDVAKLHRAADRAPHVDIVDIEADAGIHRRRGVGLADAADEYLRRGIVACQRPIGVELQIGGNLVQIGRADDLLTLELVRAEHGHRNRRVLQAFRTAAGGDDDQIPRECLPLLTAPQRPVPARHPTGITVARGDGRNPTQADYS